MAGRGGILKNPTSATFPCRKGPPIRAGDTSQAVRAGLRRATLLIQGSRAGSSGTCRSSWVRNRQGRAASLSVGATRRCAARGGTRYWVHGTVEAYFVLAVLRLRTCPGIELGFGTEQSANYAASVMMPRRRPNSLQARAVERNLSAGSGFQESRHDKNSLLSLRRIWGGSCYEGFGMPGIQPGIRIGWSLGARALWKGLRSRVTHKTTCTPIGGLRAILSLRFAPGALTLRRLTQR